MANLPTPCPGCKREREWKTSWFVGPVEVHAIYDPRLSLGLTSQGSTNFKLCNMALKAICTCPMDSISYQNFNTLLGNFSFYA